MALAVPEGSGGAGQPAVRADHDRPDAGDGRAGRLPTRSPGRTTRCGSRSRPRRRSGSWSSSPRWRWARRRPPIAAGPARGHAARGGLRARARSARVVYGAFAPAAGSASARCASCARSRRPAGPPPARPPPEGWLRLGWGLGDPGRLARGLPARAAARRSTSLSYLPWALIDNHQIVAGWPAGHTGPDAPGPDRPDVPLPQQPDARRTPPSSPWWAWPFNLKPVWFYQGAYAGTTAAAHLRRRQPGHLVARHPGDGLRGLPGVQAPKPGPGADPVAFLAQWVSWARIDRAAFQYHYYTSLPFVVLALAYFLAEVWHGASRRTWLLARMRPRPWRSWAR